jgi:hypothetical protein
MRIPESLKTDYFAISYSTIFLFLGSLCILYAILRVFYWDYRDVKLLSGIGLLILIMGLTLRYKPERPILGILGFLTALLSVLLYYFIVNSSPEWLTLIFAVGLSLMITELFNLNPPVDLRLELSAFSRNLKDDLKVFMKSESAGDSGQIEDLAEMAIDIWRLERKVTKLKEHFPDYQSLPLENSISRMKRVLQKHAIEVIDYTNQKYNEGLNVEILSVEKDSTLLESIIKETIEPAILHKGKLLKKSKIIVLEK